MRKLYLLIVAVSTLLMTASLQSCGEEYTWDGGSICFYLDFQINDENGVNLLENPDYETVADEMKLRVEYKGKDYYLNKDLFGESRAMPFEGFHTKKLSENPTTLRFGIIYPGDVNNNKFKLKYTNSEGNEVSYDILVKVTNRKKATKEHPAQADYLYYLNGERDKDGLFIINLQ